MHSKEDISSVLLFQIDLTGKAAKQYSQRRLDEEGIDITIDQWVLLKIVEESKELSQKELAQKSRRDPASITRTLDILERKGLIARTNIEGNRRQYRVVLTVGGEAFVRSNMELIQSQRDLSIEGISKEDLECAFRVLKKIQDNMS